MSRTDMSETLSSPMLILTCFSETPITLASMRSASAFAARMSLPIPAARTCVESAVQSGPRRSALCAWTQIKPARLPTRSQLLHSRRTRHVRDAPAHGFTGLSRGCHEAATRLPRGAGARLHV